MKRYKKYFKESTNFSKGQSFSINTISFEDVVKFLIKNRNQKILTNSKMFGKDLYSYATELNNLVADISSDYEELSDFVSKYFKIDYDSFSEEQSTFLDELDSDQEKAKKFVGSNLKKVYKNYNDIIYHRMLDQLDDFSLEKDTTIIFI